MNEIILVNKEKGLTSHDVVNQIRKIFNTKRVGHTGTLDPIATGLLVVCIDGATKLVQFLEHQYKKYECEIELGLGTDTLDITGNVLASKKVDPNVVNKIDDILKSMEGPCDQYPPMYSAIKINGHKLYEYARKNIDVKLAPRRVEIKELKRISDFEITGVGHIKFKFIAYVSKGTYIRSICRDIGGALFIPSVMTNLKRIEVGSFNLAEASTIDEIKDGKYKSFSMLELLSEMPKVSNEEAINKALHGMKFSLNNIKNYFGFEPEKFIVYKDEELIAIYEKDLEKYCYKAVRVWN